MKKQTAVQWLFEKITEQGTNSYLDMRFVVAEEMEKQQIKIAHLNGQSEWDIKGLADINKKLAEEYYNETYGEK
jgi:hypothetical protein